MESCPTKLIARVHKPTPKVLPVYTFNEYFAHVDHELAETRAVQNVERLVLDFAVLFVGKIHTENRGGSIAHGGCESLPMNRNTGYAFTIKQVHQRRGNVSFPLVAVR
jgi:hypothetical protein